MIWDNIGHLLNGTCSCRSSDAAVWFDARWQRSPEGPTVTCGDLGPGGRSWPSQIMKKMVQVCASQMPLARWLSFYLTSYRSSPWVATVDGTQIWIWPHAHGWPHIHVGTCRSSSIIIDQLYYSQGRAHPAGLSPMHANTEITDAPAAAMRGTSMLLSSTAAV